MICETCLWQEGVHTRRMLSHFFDKLCLMSLGLAHTFLVSCSWSILELLFGESRPVLDVGGSSSTSLWVMFGEKFTGAEFTAMKAKGLSPYVVPSSLLIQALCLERSPLCWDSISVKERRLFLLRLCGQKERRARCFPGLASWGAQTHRGE